MLKNFKEESGSTRMKVSDIIIENTPGASMFGQLVGKVNVALDKRQKIRNDKALVDQNVKKWLLTVKKLQLMGKNMRDSSVYKSELYNFLKVDDKNISNELKKKLSVKILNKSAIVDIMKQRLADSRFKQTDSSPKQKTNKQYKVGDTVTYTNKKGETRTAEVSQLLGTNKIQLKIGNAKFAVDKEQIQ